VHKSYTPVARKIGVACIKCNGCNGTANCRAVAASCSLAVDLAPQLHGHLENVQLAITNTQPHDSTRFGKELWKYWGRTLASEVSAGRLATSDLESLADIDASFAAGPAAGQRRTPAAMRAQLSSKHQQQHVAAAAAAAAATLTARQGATPPMAHAQPSPEEQQRAAAAASAAEAAADHMAQLLMVRSACVRGLHRWSPSQQL
jgi:hypothetical protein